MNKKPRNYRNNNKSERIDVSKVNPPSKTIAGKIVDATFKNGQWVW